MLRFTEGFDHHDDNTITLMNKWTAANSQGSGNNSVLQRFAGFGRYAYYGNSASWLEKTFGSNESTGVFGVACRIAADGSQQYRTCPFILYDGTSVQLFVICNSDQTISIYRGSLSNLLGTTTYTFLTNTWFYIELKWKISNSISSGDVVLYVDGVNVLSLTAGTNTRATSNSYASKFRISGDNTNIGYFNYNYVLYDDFYWLDLTGTTNNAPLGQCRIVTSFANGNGNSSQLVNQNGDSTNNYQSIDETFPDSDSTYNETGTTGNKDTYTYDDLPSTTTTIFGVAVNIVAKKTDASARTFKDQTRISSTDYEGTETALATNYINYQSIKETNPGTSVAWTRTGFNAAEFGVKCHA